MGWTASAHRSLEFAVGLVSPRRAVIMSHLRHMRGDDIYRETFFALMRARGYKAATSGSDWLASAGSGDQELSADLSSLRNRARQLDRDDSIGSGLLTLLEQQIVTRELVPQARTASRRLNAGMEAVWRERKNGLFPAESIPMGQIQRRMARCKLRDGDVFANPVKLSPDEPVWYELVEADRVDTPAELSSSGVVDGIEKDDHGRPVAAYVGRAVSGKPWRAVNLTRSDFVRVEFPALLHSKRGGRAGMTRGEPLYHAILQDIRDLDLLMLAVLKRTQIAACLSVFIKSEAAVEELLDLTAEKYGYRLDQRIEPGMMWKLQPGEEIQTLVPNFPLPDLLPYAKLLACRIGSAVGIAWEYVLRMFSEDSYSAGRTAQLASEPMWDGERHDLVDTIWTPIWTEVMRDAWLRGDPRLAPAAPSDLALVRWQGDGRKWVDPAKQAKEKETKRKLLIETWQQQCIENGTDAEDVLDQIEEIVASVEARPGIPEAYRADLVKALVFGPVKPAGPKPPAAESGADPDETQDPDESEEDENARSIRVA